jgi:hypothetical protein
VNLTKFFDKLEFPDFCNILFGKENIKIDHVYFLAMQVTADKDFVPRLMDVPNLKIENCELDLKNVKYELKELKHLELINNTIQLPTKSKTFLKLKSLHLIN